MEIWRDIEGYEGKYQISNYGRIKSKKRLDTKNRPIKERILKTSQKYYGYQTVGLTINGKTKYYYVHRLVAEAFIPNPNNYNEINHKDENATNNFVGNLEWCNHHYNCLYGTRIERSAEKHKKVS